MTSIGTRIGDLSNISFSLLRLQSSFNFFGCILLYLKVWFPWFSLKKLHLKGSKLSNAESGSESELLIVYNTVLLIQTLYYRSVIQGVDSLYPKSFEKIADLISKSFRPRFNHRNQFQGNFLNSWTRSPGSVGFFEYWSFCFVCQLFEREKLVQSL